MYQKHSIALTPQNTKRSSENQIFRRPYILPPERDGFLFTLET
ncbi:hypothetical protein HMPREF3156_00754 [Neisseria sp. HMSC06F02]|nr:hypothetical protein HMPREF3156_00754 [Neisseria sp. HMSC06F02]